MKISKKITAALLTVSVLSLTACSSASSAEETVTPESTAVSETAAIAEAASSVSDTVISGRVVAVDDDTITISLDDGDMPEIPDSEAPDDQQPSDMPSGGNGGQADDRQPPEKHDGDNGDGGNADGSRPPEKPSDENGGGQAPNGEQPPEKPDGDNGSTDQTDGQQPPEMPDGEGGGQAPDGGQFMPGGKTVVIQLSNAVITRDGEEVSASDVSVGDTVSVSASDGELDYTEQESAAPGNGGAQGGFGGSNEVTQGSAAETIDADGIYSDKTYTSTGDDENALRVDGATVTLKNITVDKASGASSNTENGDFYGMNAALLATNGATVTISDSVITSSAQNGNGVFSYGSGTTVNISDSEITTTADNSGGIQTTGGGTTNAEDLTVNTSGNSSAAIRSDRGGGTVNVNGGSYTSNGYNSPAVYSTADISVEDAELTANNSEALVIEGKNSITLTDCDVYGNMSDTEGASSDENVHSVMVYQSMSGDADVGTSMLSINGGTLTSNNGDVIYVTNTHAVISLNDVDIVNNDDEGALLRVSGNSGSRGWGEAGSNGAQVEFTAVDQTLEGNIIVDSISTLALTLSDGSEFSGTINIVDNADGAAVEDNAVVTIEKGCTWTLTGDCTVTSLVNNGTINFNGYTITLSDGTVLSK